VDISSIFAGQPGTSQAKLPPQKDLGKESFMKLLVAQLQNQDPMEPQENGAFVAQLAQFSGLEQMQEMNAGLTNLILLQQGNAMVDQLSQASTLIGLEVTWDGPNGAGIGTVDSLRVEDGLVVAMVGNEAVPLIDVVAVQAPSEGEPETEAESDQED
jgi:flagellar basal-body rod modification protein FlgD